MVFCEGLIKAFNEQPASSFDLIPKKRVFFGGLAEKIEYIAEAQIPNTVVRVTPVLGQFDSQVGAAAWHIEIEQSNNTIRLFPDEYRSILPVVHAVLDTTLTRKQVNKADLVAALQSKADWERNNWLLPLQDLNMRDKEHLELPLSLFMYYAAMDALGSRPTHLTAMSFGTRTIALVYAFIKFLYFGIFISMLSKQWSVSMTQPQPKWWRHSRFNSGRRRRGPKPG